MTKIDRVTKFVEEQTGRHAIHSNGGFYDLVNSKTRLTDPMEFEDVAVVVIQPNPTRNGDRLEAFFDFIPKDETFVVTEAGRYYLGQAIALAKPYKYNHPLPSPKAPSPKPKEALKLIEEALAHTPFDWQTGQAARDVLKKHLGKT